MRSAALAVVLVAGAALASARPLPSLQQWLGLGTVKTKGDQLWALLIAGSSGYGNYRHQADVAHAYQVLKRGGVPDTNIVVMVYDDLADNPENPRPGTLINHPSGDDVYAGLNKDYTGSQVNAANFLAVLAGNESAVAAGNQASGRVIKAGPADRVFVYYSDHGAPGILGMPYGDFLYADQLNAAIRERSARGGFAEMVLYIEACESGSIFEGLLDGTALNVYATTAANSMESSWGVYCPGMDPSPPEEYTTCLGDLYSVAWLENADVADLRAESLKKQYQAVRARTSQNFTYMQGSHVMRFGDLAMAEEPAARWEGEMNDGSQAAGASLVRAAWTPAQAVPQRDADLLPLAIAAQRGAGTPAGDAARRRLDAEVARRRGVDRGVLSAVESLALSHGGLAGLLAQHGGAAAAAEAVVAAPLPRPEGAALVDDWDCLRGMVAAWGGACGELDQYGMRHSRAFANLCNLGVSPGGMAAAAAAGGCGRVPALQPITAAA